MADIALIPAPGFLGSLDGGGPIQAIGIIGLMHPCLILALN
jgi:hypothetical protein